MAVDSNGKWVGFGLGDTDPDAPRDAPNWHAVTLLNEKLYKRFTSVQKLGLTIPKAEIDELTVQAIKLIATNYGMTLPVDANGNVVANLAFRKKIGAYPPPPPPRHAALTVRGTGGIIDQDPTSIVADWSSNHYEVPIDYAASMGGIPVGAANNPNAPSGNECAEDVHQRLTDWVLTHTATFSVFGYSLGTKGVILFLNDLFNPAHPLYAHRDRLVCVVLIADPWRPFGKSFYMGPVQEGQGIGTPYFTMSKAAQDGLGWRCCWLVNPADLYTNAPLGATGQILADIEEIILATEVSDPLATMGKAVQQLMILLTQHGGLETIFGAPGKVINQPTASTTTAPGGLFGGLLGGLLGGSLLGGGMSAQSIVAGLAGGSMIATPALAGMLLPVLLGGFQGLVSGISGNGANLPTGVAADVQAAILALKFFGSGTAPHISYGSTPWGIGPQTFLDLAIQHANDWGARVPVSV